MREKFIKYAEHLAKNNATPELVKDLKEIFCENGMFHEEGACLEKLFHITHEPELFRELGEIFQYKLRNFNVANAAYNQYLYHTDKAFFENYSKNLTSMGYSHINAENQEEKNPEDLILLCDKFDLIVFMMICLCRNKAYDEIIKLKEYLLQFKEQIISYKSDSEPDYGYMNDLENTEKHLSEILSEVRNRNDINEFAIMLNPESKRAYINVLDDSITYKKYEDAIKFYNDVYCENYKLASCDSISKICWHVSDFYRDCYEFYDAVRLQKIALELDLNISGEKCNA